MKQQLELLEQLMALANEHHLSELSIRFGTLAVSLKKAPPAEPIPPAFFQTLSERAGAAVSESRERDEGGKSLESARSADSDSPRLNLAKVVSPLAGVFYRAPSPNAKPFTGVGEPVSPGQVLCIIEAMKIMNEITAEVAGTVVQILVENGAVVEEGETLFLIDRGGGS